MRYCERCGTSLQRGSIDGKERMHCPACGFVRYANPMPVGLAMIESPQGLVMVKRAAAPLADYWAPPCGYVEIGESVPQAVVREAREECGLEIEVNSLINVFSAPEVNVLILAYRARVTGGTLRAGDDAAEAAIFPAGALPEHPATAADLALDKWFHTVVAELTAPWRRMAHRTN